MIKPTGQHWTALTVSWQRNEGEADQGKARSGMRKVNNVLPNQSNAFCLKALSNERSQVAYIIH